MVTKRGLAEAVARAPVEKARAMKNGRVSAFIKWIIIYIPFMEEAAGLAILIGE